MDVGQTITESEEPAELDADKLVPLTTPLGGVPDVIDTVDGIKAAAQALAAGSGAFAIDTERASGYRYSQRAYLVQIKRANVGTMLIDPIAVNGKVDALAEVLNPEEWVLHAASQDLPCLAELGLRPAGLFDTELAGRLAGFERVALGILVARQLGFHLEKGYGAADWSTRPLPPEWLAYAALDVELLLELKQSLEQELRQQGKLTWALEEFEAVRTAPLPQNRQEPWRRTSGIHRVRKPRHYAAVRALWEARDAIAQRRDTAPGRVLPDAAIVEAALAEPASQDALIKLAVFRGRGQRRLAHVWWNALQSVKELSARALPQPNPPHEGPPPVNRWADRDPAAAARLAAVRAALTELADQLLLPVENLTQPDLIRRLCWHPPVDLSAKSISQVLRAGGARNWQIDQVAQPLATVLSTLNSAR